MASVWDPGIIVQAVLIRFHARRRYGNVCWHIVVLRLLLNYSEALGGAHLKFTIVAFVSNIMHVVNHRLYTTLESAAMRKQKPPVAMHARH